MVGWMVGCTLLQAREETMAPRTEYDDRDGGANHGGPPGDCRGPPGDCRVPPGDCRVPPGDCRVPPSDCLVTPGDCRVPPRYPGECEEEERRYLGEERGEQGFPGEDRVFPGDERGFHGEDRGDCYMSGEIPGEFISPMGDHTPPPPGDPPVFRLIGEP